MNNDSRPTFRFQNLGPIKEAELELGDLTIIAGRNNTGKTYVAYALYGFLQRWSSTVDLNEVLSRSFSRFFIEFIRQEAKGSGHLKLPTDKDALQKLRKKIIDQAARAYSENDLRGVFSADIEAFKNASFKVLPGDPPDIDIERFEHPSASLNQEGDEWILSLKGSFSEFLAMDGLTLVMEIVFPEMFFFPLILTSERFGISLFHRELDFARSEIVRELQQMASNDSEKKSGLRSAYELIRNASSRYLRSIQDNINFTRAIPDLVKFKSGLYEQKRHDDIKRIMGGYFRVENGGVRFVSTARGDRRFNIPLYQASSSARGLSDLYFYMRHVAKRGQLLMVDEPEAHLDTANQIEMTRLLARLARSGVKVLITTHSDYIVKEINNLIMLSQPFRNKEAVRKRLKYGEDDYLHADQVRAYIAEDGSLSRCKTNPYGIEYPNFDDTIDAINRVSNELSERVWEEQEE